MPAVKHIRSAARAVIISNGCLLATKMRDKRGVYYILPGGGQQPGETLEDTVKRECLEEVGIPVNVVRLLYVREYIGKNHTFSKRHAGFHQIEHVFLCEVEDPTRACPGRETDNYQIGVNWLSLEAFAHIRFYPESIKPYITTAGVEFPSIYLGDCN
ncbi:MAG: NUDIX domain-containing protein [Oceanipulchritudo sp.]